MKRKFISVLFVMIFFGFGANAQLNQSNSKDIIVSEGFESWPLAGWTIVNNDGGPNEWFEYSTTYHSGSKCAAIEYEAANDDWLISPQFTVVTGTSLKFYARSYSSSALEDFNVKVSTATNDVADFTITLENVVSAPTSWTEYSYDLTGNSALNIGDQIYVAIQYVSSNKWRFLVDDFEVSSPPQFDASITEISSPTNNFFPGNTDIIVNLKNFGTDEFSTCDVNYSVYDITNDVFILQNETYTWTGTALIANDDIDITIGNYTAIGTTTYSITATSVLAGDSNTPNDEATIEVSTIFGYSTPYNQEFEIYPPTDWTEAKGLLENPINLTGTTSYWEEDDYLNTTDPLNKSAKINIYSSNRQEWLFTPLIDLGATGQGNVLKFNLALTDYGNSNSPEGVGSDDKFAVVISTDAGQTWTTANILQLWDNTSAPSFGDIPTTGETITIDLSAYSGIIKIGFYGESTMSNNDNDLFIDNVYIYEPQDYDASITQIISPSDGFSQGNTDIIVNLKNYGTYSITTCDINYSVYDVTNDVFVLENQTYSWTSTGINSDESVDVNIGSFTSEVSTTYSITVTSVLAEDTYAGNDELSTEVSSIYVYPLPFEEDFESYLPTDWSEAKGLLQDPVELTGTTSYWTDDDYLNITNPSNNSAKINIYSSTRNEWLITPSINIGAVGNGALLKFNLALTDYGNSDTPEGVGDDDKFAVVISTDDGQTWTTANILQLWDNTTTPSYGDISTTGEEIIIDLSAYSGIIKIGLYGESTMSNNDNDLFVDNLSIAIPPDNDAAIDLITFPADNFASGNTNIYVDLANYGLIPFSSCEINYDVFDVTNDVFVLENQTYSWTASAINTGEFVNINIGSFPSVGTTTYSISTTSNLINDEISENNQANIVVTSANDYDAAITQITSPISNLMPGSTDISVMFSNNGTYSITTCDIDYSVYDVTNQAYIFENQAYTWTGSLNHDEEVEITLNNFTANSMGTYSITATSYLVNDANSNNDEVHAEYTTNSVYSIPYLQVFDTYPPTDWTEASGILQDPITISGTTSYWEEEDYLNIENSSNKSANINIWSDNKNDWMFTPFINLGDEGHGAVLKFDLGLTDYGNSNPTESIGDDDKFAVVISTDYGQTWTSTNILQLWNNTTTPSFGDISPTGETVVLDLASYSGIVIFGFYGESTASNADNDLFVDNVKIYEPQENDATITEIVSPVGNFAPGSSDIIVNLKNEGNNSFENCDIIFDVYDVTNNVNILQNQIFTWSGTAINTGENIDVNIGSFTSEFSTTYSITAISMLTGDTYAGNDKATIEASTFYAYPIPYIQDFENYPPTDWSEAKGIFQDPVELIGSTSYWDEENYLNIDNPLNNSANINIYSYNRNEWLFTPLLMLGEPGHGAYLKFDLALTDWNNSDSPEDIGDDDKFAVVISTDAGQTWTTANTLQLWDITTTPAYGDISTTGETIIIDLEAYSGIIMIGFYGESTESNADNDLFVDNVSILVQDTYTVTFYVHDQFDSGLEGATVTIGSQSVNTDENGNAEFSLPVGEASYEVSFNSEVVNGTYQVTEEANQIVSVEIIVGSIPHINSDFNIYPNPSNGEFTVELDGIYNLKIFDLSGRMIMEQKIINKKDISLNKKGVYMLHFTNEKNVINYKIIIK